MLNRVLREACRYEIRFDANELLSIGDRYTNITLRAGIVGLAEAEALCQAMNVSSVRNALLLPTIAMAEAGGVDAADVWLRMVRAAL